MVIDSVRSNWRKKENNSEHLQHRNETVTEDTTNCFKRSVEPTWANFDEAIVLDEDGVTGEVAMNDGRFTWVQVTGE